jgi:hypothetical protein
MSEPKLNVDVDSMLESLQKQGFGVARVALPLKSYEVRTEEGIKAFDRFELEFVISTAESETKSSDIPPMTLREEVTFAFCRVQQKAISSHKVTAAVTLPARWNWGSEKADQHNQALVLKYLESLRGEGAIEDRLAWVKTAASGLLQLYFEICTDDLFWPRDCFTGIDIEWTIGANQTIFFDCLASLLVAITNRMGLKVAPLFPSLNTIRPLLRPARQGVESRFISDLEAQKKEEESRRQAFADAMTAYWPAPEKAHSP